jgi:anti-sigma factor ChrR (cupin superfamily)
MMGMERDTADRGEKHPDDRSRETAALLAAGALPPGEARAFEEHARACAACAAELAALRETAARLGMAAADRAPAPPAGLREKVLARAAADAPAPRVDEAPPPAAETQVWKLWSGGGEAEEGLRILRRGEGTWEPTASPGVSVKPLHVDSARRYVTMLVRMEPGSSYPGHLHAGAEECFVLDGELRVGDEVLQRGDYQRAAEGSEHGRQWTEKGCLLLIVSSQDDELVGG